MAKGQVNLMVTRTDDSNLLLQIQEPDIVDPRIVRNNLTVHKDVDGVVEALKRKLNQMLP